MKKTNRMSGSKSSGQLLIVTALSIAILISTTTIYIYELSSRTNLASLSTGDSVLAIKQSTRNTMMSSLANTSSGGEKGVLTTNLDMLSEVLQNLNRLGISNLVFSPQNDSKYDSGIWLSWNTNDIGVSSANANFTLEAYDVTTTITLSYAINITTALTVNGSYTSLGSGEKIVNVTCTVYNEAEPALAKNMSLFYYDLGNWTQVDSSNDPSILDHGNGTYSISFTVEVPTDFIQVSVHIHDLRDVFVRTNSTCYEN